jgi:hypothetical protein
MFSYTESSTFESSAEVGEPLYIATSKKDDLVKAVFTVYRVDPFNGRDKFHTLGLVEARACDVEPAILARLSALEGVERKIRSRDRLRNL